MLQAEFSKLHCCCESISKFVIAISSIDILEQKFPATEKLPGVIGCILTNVISLLLQSVYVKAPGVVSPGFPGHLYS